jgi:hypothetical protein
MASTELKANTKTPTPPAKCCRIRADRESVSSSKWCQRLAPNWRIIHSARHYTEADHIIRLFLEHSKAFLAREGRLSNKDVDGIDYAGGVHLKEYKRLVGMTTLILLDKYDSLIEQERVKLQQRVQYLGH